MPATPNANQQSNMPAPSAPALLQVKEQTNEPQAFLTNEGEQKDGAQDAQTTSDSESSSVCTVENNTPLRLPVRAGNIKQAAEIFQQLDLSDIEKLYSVINYSLIDDPQLIQHLITTFNLQAIVNSPSSKGLTPLQFAQERSLVKIGKYLQTFGGKEEKAQDPIRLIDVIEEIGFDHILHTNQSGQSIKERIKTVFHHNQHLSSRVAQDRDKNTPLIRAVHYGNLPAVEALFEIQELSGKNPISGHNKSVGIHHDNSSYITARIASVFYSDKGHDDADQLLTYRRKIALFLLQKYNSIPDQELKAMISSASAKYNLYFLRTIFLSQLVPKNKSLQTELCEIGCRAAIIDDNSAIFDFWHGFQLGRKLKLHPHLLAFAAQHTRFSMAKKLLEDKDLDINWTEEYSVFQFTKRGWTEASMFEFWRYNSLGRALLNYAHKKISREAVLEWIDLLQNSNCTSDMLVNAITGSEDDNTEVFVKLGNLPNKPDLNSYRGDFNGFSGCRNTPLEKAAGLGRINHLNYLLAQPNIQVNHGFSYPIYNAALMGSFPCIVALQERGANFYSALFHPRTFDVNKLAIVILNNRDDQSEKIINFLLEKYARVRSLVNDSFDKDLICEHITTLEKLYPDLLTDSYIKGLLEFVKEKLLQLAADTGKVKTLCTLIKHGASILQRRNLVMTFSPALEAAVKNKWMDFFIAVESNEKSKREATSFSPGNELLLSAIENSDDKPELIDKLISLFKFNLNEPYNGRTPMMCAAAKGYHRVIVLLAQKGAVLNLEPRFSALQTAKKNGQKATVKLLLRSHAIDTESKHIQAQEEAKEDPTITHYLKAVRLIRQNRFNTSIEGHTTATETNEITLDLLVDAMDHDDLQDLYFHFQYSVQEPKLRHFLQAKNKNIKFSPHALIIVNPVTSSAEQAENIDPGNITLDAAITNYVLNKNSNSLKMVRLVVERTPLNHKVVSAALWSAITSDDVDLLNCLLSAFQEKNFPVDFNTSFALFNGESLTYLERAARGMIKTLQLLLQQPGIQADRAKALFAAIQQGFLETTKLLIANDAVLTKDFRDQLKLESNDDSPHKQKVKNYIRAVLCIMNEYRNVSQEALVVHAEDRENLYQFFHMTIYQNILDGAYPELAKKYQRHDDPPAYYAPNAPLLQVEGQASASIDCSNLRSHGGPIVVEDGEKQAEASLQPEQKQELLAHPSATALLSADTPPPNQQAHPVELAAQPVKFPATPLEALGIDVVAKNQQTNPVESAASQTAIPIDDKAVVVTVPARAVGTNSPMAFVAPALQLAASAEQKHHFSSPIHNTTNDYDYMQRGIIWSELCFNRGEFEEANRYALYAKEYLKRCGTNLPYYKNYEAEINRLLKAIVLHLPVLISCNTVSPKL